MNTFTPQSLKKLLIALGLSILIIMIFLLLKLFFTQAKTTQYKEFKHAKAPQKETKQIKEEPKLLLLPSKN